MPLNGAGVYSPTAGSTPTDGDTADAADLADFVNDLTTVLNTTMSIGRGGTGATTASGARTNLGITSLSAPAGDRVLGYDLSASSAAYFTLGAGLEFSGTELRTTASAYALTLFDDADAAAARTTLGLGSAATLIAGTGANNLVQLDGSGALPAVDGSALTGIGSRIKAWATFNGTGTVAITDSFNVTSITDNGVGDYTINFTTGFGADYAVFAMGIPGTSDVNYVVGFDSASAIADGSVRIQVLNRAGAAADLALISVVAIK